MKERIYYSIVLCFQVSLIMINVINLSVISYDRLSAIVLPHETRLTREGAKIVIMVSWIISLVVASPLMIYRQYKVRITSKISIHFAFKLLLIYRNVNGKIF